MADIKEWLESDTPRIVLCENKSNAKAWIGCKNDKDGMVLGGIKMKTLQELSREIVDVGLVYDMNESGSSDIPEIRECDDSTAELAIRQIVRDIISAPGYTGDIKISSVDSALGMEFLRVLRELRLGKRVSVIQLKDKDASQYEFVCEVLDKYEKFLGDNDLYDYCRLITEASSYLESFSNAKKLLPQYKQYELGILTPWDLMPEEERFIGLFKENTADKSLTEVDACEKKTEEQDITFVKAYTFTGEIRNAADLIRKENIPLSEVDILCMNRSLADISLMVLAEEGIPARMSGSNSALSNNILKFIFDYCDWIIKGGIEDLDYKIRNSGTVYVGDIYDDNRSGISGGKKREEADARYKAVFEELRKINSGKCSISDLLNSLHEVFKEYSMSLKSVWSEYKPVFDKLYGRYALYADKLDIRDAALEIKNAISKISVGSSQDTSAVRISVLGNRYITDRDYLFIVGMSDMHFRISNADSPVLPSDVISCVNEVPEIFRRSDEERKEVYLTDTLKACRSKRIIMSYASYDISSEIPKEIPVSLYLNDLMRKLGRVKKAGRDGEPDILVPDIEKKGFDLPVYNYIENKGLLDKKPQDSADAAQTSVDQTGKNARTVITSSALCKLLSCPRQYYYNKVRGIYINEERSADTGRWLNAAQKGLLCHEVFELYCKSELQEKDTVLPNVNEAEFNAIFDKITAKWKKDVPPVSEVVFKNESEDYKITLHGTLEELHGLLNSPPDNNPWKVFDMELEVGTNRDDAYASTLLTRPQAGGGSKQYDLFYYGTIDRIDHYMAADGVEHFRMLDYKTGNKATKIKEITGGKWPQHIVYAALLDAYIKKTKGKDYKYKLDEFIYLFPFEKKDRIYVIKNEDGKNNFEFKEDTVEKIVRSLFDGNYTSNADRSTLLKDKAGLTYGFGPDCCTYCDYKDICVDRMGNKL